MYIARYSFNTLFLVLQIVLQTLTHACAMMSMHVLKIYFTCTHKQTL